MSGFTALSERLGHEVLADLMNELGGRFNTVISELRGRIDKHMGDAVRGRGVEATREDDPERAVRADLLLQEAVAGFRATSGYDVRLRVGVNTAPALLGFVGRTSKHTIMGDTVNVASRLQHISPVGAVLIAHDMYRHVRGYVRRRSRPSHGRAGRAGTGTGIRRSEGEATHVPYPDSRCRAGCRRAQSARSRTRAAAR